MNIKSESFVCENRRVRGSMRYPVGDVFGDFYAQLAKKCRIWLEREYSEYSGRGLTYRFFCDAVKAECGIVSVTSEIALYEKGRGLIKRNFFARTWLSDGRICFGTYFYF